MQADAATTDPALLKERIRGWALELGFQSLGVSDVDLGEDAARLRDWMARGWYGDMDWMAHHGDMRERPELLHAGAIRAICVRMDYATSATADDWAALADGSRAYVARYARGRDYHKLMRGRLQKLADRIAGEFGPFGYRAFVDSAPLLERALARKAGLGWAGKHTVVIDRDHGSWFFLGEILTDLPLPVDAPASAHCGTCTRCIEVCPTQAIVAPNLLDASRCIAYLTIEHKGSIPEALRAPIGNRVFGCDDCQLVCPWNKFARQAAEPDFKVRNRLDAASLVELFAWSEDEFLQRTEGSAIRRLGHERWLRNIAVGLGNAPTTPEVIAALRSRAGHPSELVREHVAWALARHGRMRN
ncbi:MAG: tRNA epoxyqueuosine(34) reductase QueG [Proteobacteria bacterium]|nr:tRNA epoxyqueuosine(34) reductase QueG [Pseudomonadota bacterium]